MNQLYGIIIGAFVGFVVRYLGTALYTVDQNERAVKLIFGRAERIGTQTTLDDPISENLKEEEKSRYSYPQLKVIAPGGLYWKWPWEKIIKVSVATETVSMAQDPEDSNANAGGRVLEAVTRDQLDTGLTGQIRYRVADRNLYAFLFGVKNPYAHIMGYFVAVLRERIANFEAPKAKALGPNDIAEPISESASVIGVSINDLRKNLRDINEHMDKECLSSAARYGIVLDASLITSIDPPPEVESALAAINTAHNQVSSDISLAQAAADQKVVQSKRAVEIETLKAEAEVEPLLRLASQLQDLKQSGTEVLKAYARNIRLELLTKAKQIYLEMQR